MTGLDGARAAAASTRSALTAHASGWPHEVAPFHAGERALQARAGVAGPMAQIGPRVMRGAMPDPHRELFEKLPFMVVGALDGERRPWATAIAGAPGFVRSPDARSLVLGGRPIGAEVLGLRLQAGAPVGLLGIEPSTLRRNRVNGVVGESMGRSLRVEVRQSFGNCPKYIQARDFAFAPSTERAATPLDRALPGPAAALVLRADTFFIATASADAGGPAMASNGGVDVSHRGGRPGFVKIDLDADGGTVLTVPDFLGNFFFNTLGNVAVNPKAGLLFIDWANGDMLNLTGDAEIVWDGREVESFAGAQRLLRVRVRAGWWMPAAMPWPAPVAEASPQLAATGRW